MKIKFNVKPVDAQYIINKEKRMVVCIINNTKNLFIEFVNTSLVNNNWCSMRGMTDSILDELEMPNRFTGIATCSKDDEWSEDIGKLIAFSRAKDNLNKSFFKRAQKYINIMDNYLNRSIEIINSLGEKLTINSERRHNLINSILEHGESE